MKNYCLCFIVISLFMCGTGCRPTPQPLTGKVTYDGQPLSKGIIVLTPDADKSERKVPTQAGIANGTFSIPAKFGVFTGKYSITIEEPEITVPTTDEEGGSTTTSDASQHFDRIGFPTYTFQHTFVDDGKPRHLDVDIPKGKETRKRR